jgi:hypothetical protein
MNAHGGSSEQSPAAPCLVVTLVESRWTPLGAIWGVRVTGTDVRNQPAIEVVRGEVEAGEVKRTDSSRRALRPLLVVRRIATVAIEWGVQWIESVEVRPSTPGPAER